MDLRRLAYFVTVADHGSFSAAARAAFVSQPALSLAVKELEREVGAELFVRLGRAGVVLTPAGVALLEPARQALRDVETGQSAVDDVVGLRRGTLAIACLPTLAADPLAALIGRFLSLHPQVRIDLAAPEGTTDVVTLLRNGQCEVGVADNVAVPDDLLASVVAVQELIFIVGPTMRVPATTRSLADLATVPMITTPEGTSSRTLLDTGFAAVECAPLTAVVTAQREAILPLVLAGAGAALVPEPMAAVAVRLGATTIRPDPPIVREVSVVRRQATLAPAAQQFVALATGAR
jgi:LysR family transcriptional regulator, carnitine catabolism transcriptional activator